MLLFIWVNAFKACNLWALPLRKGWAQSASSIVWCGINKLDDVDDNDEEDDDDDDDDDGLDSKFVGTQWWHIISERFELFVFFCFCFICMYFKLSNVEFSYTNAFLYYLFYACNISCNIWLIILCFFSLSHLKISTWLVQSTEIFDFFPAFCGITLHFIHFAKICFKGKFFVSYFFLSLPLTFIIYICRCVCVYNSLFSFIKHLCQFFDCLIIEINFVCIYFSLGWCHTKKKKKELHSLTFCSFYAKIYTWTHEHRNFIPNTDTLSGCEEAFR